jgi:hypothetical protein
MSFDGARESATSRARAGSKPDSRWPVEAYARYSDNATSPCAPKLLMGEATLQATDLGESATEIAAGLRGQYSFWTWKDLDG